MPNVNKIRGLSAVFIIDGNGKITYLGLGFTERNKPEIPEDIRPTQE